MFLGGIFYFQNYTAIVSSSNIKFHISGAEVGGNNHSNSKLAMDGFLDFRALVAGVS